MKTESAACVLLLDTSGDTGTVALAVGGRLRAVRTMERARDYAVVLNDIIDEILTEGDVKLRDLTAVSVMAGPGSYTGLRLALSAAKGLCYALEIPLFLQNGLHLLAEEARVAQSGYEVYITVLPARLNEYFFAVFDATGAAIVEPRHLKVSDAAEVMTCLPSRSLAVGNGAAVEELFSAQNFIGQKPAILVRNMPSLDSWMKVTLAQICTAAPADLAYAEPFYLKAAYTTTPKASR